MRTFAIDIGGTKFSVAAFEDDQLVRRESAVTDRDGGPVFLAKSAWEIGYVADRFPNVKFLKTRERHEVHAES